MFNHLKSASTFPTAMFFVAEPAITATPLNQLRAWGNQLPAACKRISEAVAHL